MDRSHAWIDGCFDFFHYGHANAILQAKGQFARLTAGVHSDEDILANKGPTVMALGERMELVGGNEWVYEAVAGAPYVTQLAWMDRYDCYWCVHGDDVTTDAAGHNCYQAVMDAGRFRIVKRTRGVSTTDLIGRILAQAQRGPSSGQPQGEDAHLVPAQDARSHLDAHADLVRSFCAGADGQPRKRVWLRGAGYCNCGDLGDLAPDSCVVVAGSFDLFAGYHSRALKHVRQAHPGKRVVVQLAMDRPGFIMNLVERLLGVLQSRYLDAVVVGDDLAVPCCQHYDIAQFGPAFGDINSTLNRIRDNQDLFAERQTKKLAKAAHETQMGY